MVLSCLARKLQKVHDLKLRCRSKLGGEHKKLETYSLLLGILTQILHSKAAVSYNVAIENICAHNICLKSWEPLICSTFLDVLSIVSRTVFILLSF